MHTTTRSQTTVALAKATMPILLLLTGIYMCAFGCRSGSGSGPNKFSSPSRSERSAKKLGVFKNDVSTSNWMASPDLSWLKLEEAWLEEIVERDESTLARIRAVGERLCVRLNETQDRSLAYSDTAELTGLENEKIGLGLTVLSGNSVVLSFDSQDSPPIPAKGRIVISRKDGGEIASFSYSIEGKGGEIPGY